jgi:hypothetical protein
MSLNDWVDNGWLTEHQTSAEEIRNLLAVCERDIRDCQAEGLSQDWRMNIAYNAALQAATAALAACGYRASREAHHYRVIQTLVHTIGAEKDLVIQFDQFRKKRNIGGYEQAGLVSKKEAEEMFKLAVELRKRVQWWFEASFPGYL